MLEVPYSYIAHRITIGMAISILYHHIHKGGFMLLRKVELKLIHELCLVQYLEILPVVLFQ